MRKIISTAILLHALAFLISCAGGSTQGSHEFSTPAPAEVLTASVPVQPGTYKASASCVSGKEISADSPQSIFQLKADGTYTEQVSVRGADCKEKECDLFLMGDYKITYSKVSFHQKIKLNRNLKNDPAEQTKEFAYLGADAEKGEIYLQDSSADNSCAGKMKLVLSLKDSSHP